MSGSDKNLNHKQTQLKQLSLVYEYQQLFRNGNTLFSTLKIANS